jgi:signal transduction histidine kinase
MRLGARDYVLDGCDCNSLFRALKYAIERKEWMAAIRGGSVRVQKDRRELVSRNSHDLRNALACIHQFGNILLDGLAGPISEEQRQYVGIMTQNASRIRTIAENLVDAVPSGIDESLLETDQAPSTTGVN